MTIIKRALALFLILTLSLPACISPSASAASPENELIVFAAASLTEPLSHIAELYRESVPDVGIIFNFDSSGTLKTQIVEGADCDVFISAAPKQLNALDAYADTDNSEGLDFILEGSRIDLLENKVALAVPEGNPSGIYSFDDLISGLQNGSVLLSIGNSDVPVGQYTLKLFDYFGLDELKLASRGCLTYGSNAKEVTLQVSEAAADCGIVYSTDAFSAGLEIVDTADNGMCGQVIYPAAVLNISRSREAALDFLNYLSGPEAAEVFKAAGFSVMTACETE